jgi:hypothetical protein
MSRRRIEGTRAMSRVTATIGTRQTPHQSKNRPTTKRRDMWERNRARKHELGNVITRHPLRGFASYEKLLPVSRPPLPSHHSALSVLLTAAVAASISSASAVASSAYTAYTVPASRTLALAPAPSALAQAPCLWPDPSCLSLKNLPSGPTPARRSTTATISSSSTFSDTGVLSDVDVLESQ